MAGGWCVRSRTVGVVVGVVVGGHMGGGRQAGGLRSCDSAVAELQGRGYVVGGWLVDLGQVGQGPGHA
jgi:hypothetical protein